MANCSLNPLFTPLSPKTPNPVLSFPSKPKILLLSHSSSSVPSWASLKSKLSSSGGPFIALVARTNDWARQDEASEHGEAGFDSEGEETEPRASDWKGEGEGEEPIESGDEEEEGSGESPFPDEGEPYNAVPPPPKEVKIFVGNLTKDMDSAALVKLFNMAGIVETAEVIYNLKTGKTRGFGFVSMSTVEEAEKAIQMFNGYEVDGKPLTVSKAAPRRSRVERGYRIFVPFNIYVGNIPWNVDHTRLEQLFSVHGKVVGEAKIVYDKQSGRSRGFGFVTMSSQAELQNAIDALDGSILDGRLIKVCVAEEKRRRPSF